MVNHRQRGPGKVSMAASASVHSAVIILAWLSQVVEPAELQFVAYEIELVSSPAQVEEAPAPREEVVVETPEPEPIIEEDDVPPPEPEEEPEPETPLPTIPPVEDEEPTEEGGQDINVRMEGLRRDFPDYYQNIILQISRCFRWRGQGNLEAVVGFVIQEDGSVSDLHFVQESGNVEFDIQAMGAVECAGDRFGPLPDDMPWDRQPVAFSFRPPGRGGVEEAGQR